MRRITIAEVAKQAGVSTMTVSRVLNGRGEISIQTRTRVQEIIEKLGYRPNSLARNLKTQTTQTIGLIVPDITNPFFPEFVKGAEDKAAELGYAMILCDFGRNPAREKRALQLLEDKRVDGLILCSSGLPDEELVPLLKNQRAVVLFDRLLEPSIAGAVRVDDVYGGMLAANHLIQLGCRKFGLLSGPKYYLGSGQRRYGFYSAIETRGNKPDTIVESPCEPDETGGYEAAKELLTAHREIDGLFCFNDLVALGALQACGEFGIPVPQRLAIVGFDDIRLARLTVPQLTTIRVDKYGLGTGSVELLLKRLNAESTADTAEVVFRPELVIRGSAPEPLGYPERKAAKKKSRFIAS
jgi:LacI family transcriptional regulator